MFILLMILMGNQLVVDDIFSPLVAKDVSVAKDGTIFILDSAEAQVLKISPTGVKKRISGRGQGPSELMVPYSIALDQDRLYVFDFAQNIKCFDNQGLFVKSIKLPHQGVLAYHVYGGWVYLKEPLDKKGKSVFYLTDLDGVKSVPLKTFENKSENLFIGKSTPKKVEFDYNPVADRVRWTLSLDKRKMFVYFPEDPNIKIFELPSGKQIGSFGLGRSQMKFDTSWGQKRIDSVSQNVTQNGVKVTAIITPKFPSYFPLVVDMWTGPDDAIWISTVESLYNPNAPLNVFTAKGQKIKNKYSDRLAGHLLAVVNEHVYVSVMNLKTENPEIYKLAIGEVDQINDKLPPRVILPPGLDL